MSSVALKFPGNRVQFAALPTAAAPPAFEVGFVGYCHRGRRDLDVDAAVAALGFDPDDGDTQNDSDEQLDADRGAYFDQPVPVDSWDQFLYTFGPRAKDRTASDDALAGQKIWLPGAVADYFAAGGRRAWIIRARRQPTAPEDAHVPGVIVVPGFGTARGLAAACAIPTLGLVAFPDLERLFALPQVKTPVPPPAPVPMPVFRPLGAVQPGAPPGASTIRANGSPPGLTAAPADVLSRIVHTLAALRPDVTALFTLPAGLDTTATLAAVEDEALGLLYGGAAGISLPLLQPVLPLLRDTNSGINSPCGLLAGTIAATAERDGVWRSIAGRPIASSSTPVRRVSDETSETLRLNGVAAIHADPSGGVVLETEALAVPFDDAARAAPTRRFIGWLHRQLQQYGDGLVFENDPEDGHVELVLAGFFAELFQRGALKARRLSDAFTIRRMPASEGTIIFEIRFSPSFAIDTIVLRLVQNADGALSVQGTA